MRFLSNKTTAKVVSVFVAIIIWMYVVSVENPTTTLTYRDIPVTVLNEEQLNNSGYSLISVTDTAIDVKVEGRRTDVSTVTSKDIIATIDVSNINLSGKYMTDIKVSVKADGVMVKSVEQKQTEVYVDTIKSVEVPVTVNTTGMPKGNFKVGELKSSVEKITVKGPGGIINKISTAKVNVDLTDVDENINRIYPVKLYDYADKEIDLTYLSLTSHEATVSAAVIHTVEAEIRPDFTSEISGYEITIKPDKITVEAEKEFDGVIYTKPITVENSESTFTIESELNIPPTVKTGGETPKTVLIEFKQITE